MQRRTKTTKQTYSDESEEDSEFDSNVETEYKPTTALKAVKSSESNTRKILLRLVAGLIMIGTFFTIIYSGHIYAWMLVVVLQVLFICIALF